MNNRTSPRVIPFDYVYEQTKTAPLHADTITVAVSLFNYAHFVIACLDSIARQRHERIDLIVVDDCSNKDQSVDVVESWMKQNGERFERVTLIRHRRNSGLAEARNTAFHLARTDFVFVMDADNEIYPRALRRLFDVMQTTEFDAAYTQLEFFGNEVRLGYADVWRKRRFKQGNYVDAMAMISRRSWMQVQGYTHVEGGWEDFDFWCKFLAVGMAAAYIPEILCRYRVHGTSMLRTETVGMIETVKTQMMFRHPWLHL
jgi:glycosyltransferase involved in cell wall biosynthesis